MCLMVSFIKTMTCQWRQLKLNPLSMQINIYCLMTNQMPALIILIQAPVRIVHKVDESGFIH